MDSCTCKETEWKLDFLKMFCCDFEIKSKCYCFLFMNTFLLVFPLCFFFADAVAITWTDRVFPSLTWVIPFAISASLFSNLLLNIFEASRVTYIASEEGQLPLLFYMLNIHSSPLLSVLLTVTMASFAIVLTSLIDLINYLYFMISFWSVLAMIGILKLRYQEPDLPRPYKVRLIFLLFLKCEIKDTRYNCV